MIILRYIIINSSLRGLRSVSDATDEHNIYLGLFTKLLFARLIAIYSSLKIHYMLPPTYTISCNYCSVTFVPLFINLRHPRDFTSHTSRRGTLYYYVYMCFLVLRHFFFFRPWVFSRALGSVARKEPARTPHAGWGPGRGPWHVLWGFKVASLLGDGFRARGAIQAHANPRT